MTANDEAPITEAEMREMFGSTLPMEAVSLLWSTPDGMTVGQVRAKLREIGRDRRERLRSLGRFAGTLAPILDVLLKFDLDGLPGYGQGEWSRRNVEAILADLGHAIASAAETEPKS